MKLYAELADWWPLMSPPDDYAEEARVVASLLDPQPRGARLRVLELGSGGGHLASHLKARFEMTLVDRSPEMLAVSRRLNPECRHLRADMRTLRLSATFDAILIFDAISHLVDVSDLLAALVTARAHLEVGSVALFCPDWTRETFRPGVAAGGSDAGDRGLRYLEWTHPAIEATSYRTDIAYLLRHPDGAVTVVHDHVRLGVFSRAEWRRTCRHAGFDAAEIRAVAGRDVILARAA
jgi:SAM-dependent methyltransferase